MTEISDKQIDDFMQNDVAKKYLVFRELVKEFLIWKANYGISEFLWNEEDKENLSKVRSLDEKLVWTVLSYEEHEAMSGFEETPGDRVEGWFLATKACERLGTIIPLETHMDCPVCDASGEVDGDDCEECDSQGDIMFQIDY